MPVFNMKFGLKWKTIIGLGLLLSSALLIMGGMIYYHSMHLVINELLNENDRAVEKETIAIESFLKSSKDDLMVLASTPPIQGIIRAKDNSGLDPLTRDKTEYWEARLTQIFGALLKYHPEYCQVRYLDEKGDELVRANLTGEKIWITPRQELQNKGQDSYFTETMKIRENEVYYSAVNLNRKQGVIQIPHTPVFRIATPVYDTQEKIRGIVVINIVPAALFSNLSKESGETRKYVINEDGYFLVHPDKEWEFGFDLGNEYIIKDLMPEFPEEMKERDAHVKYHKELHHVDAFKKVFYDPLNRNHWWAVIYETPERSAFENINAAKDSMLFVGLCVLVTALIIITWVSSKLIVTPILNLSKAVNDIEHGDFSARIPEDGRKDELGELAVSVNRMAAIIGKNFYELAILNQITIAAASSLSLSVTANRVLDALLELQLLKLTKKAAIFLTDEMTCTLKLLASRGFSKEHEALDAVVPFGDCLCGKAAETGEPIISERCCDKSKHTRKYPGMALHGHIIIPLKSGETTLGVLALYLPNDTKIAPEEVRFYQSIGDVIAVSLQNSLQYTKIEGLKSQHGLILNSMGEGLYGLNSEGVCTFMNPTAERMLGYERGELIGALLHDVTHHTRSDGSTYLPEECRIYVSFKENRVQHVEDELFWRKDGSNFPVEYTSTPTFDKNGAPIGAVVVFSDITERRQAEETIKEYAETLEAKVNERTSELNNANMELKKLVNAIEQSDESIIITDIKGTIQYVNPVFITRTGYSREEAIGSNPLILQSGLTPKEIYRDLWKTILSGRPWKGTLINEKKSGELYHEDATIAPVVDEQGKITNFVAVKTDVTARIIAAQELQHKNEELALAMEASEAATQAKSDFLANMSHELRTPLNAIIGFSDIMLTGMTGPLTDEQAEFMGDIGNSGKHLLTIINDILDLSKVEAGKMELEASEVGVKDLIERCLVMFKEKSLKHCAHVEFTVEEAVGDIVADEMKLKQVLVNLLSNAFKFTPDGGSVSVRARLIPDFGLLIAELEKEGRLSGDGVNDLVDSAGSDSYTAIEISVADTGVGISEADISRLFQPFQQLATTLSQKVPGTGLGLNLCKKFVEMHGGRIWAESEVGKGSTFRFVIPLLPGQ